MSAGFLVLIDIGNTNTVVGVFEGDDLVADFRLTTARERTADEYGALLLTLFKRSGIEIESTRAVVVASVVPPLSPVFDAVSRQYLGRKPLFVEPGVKTGIPIRSDDPAEVGADRIVNAVAVRSVYGVPAVVVDFGTATTFDVVNPAGEYAGGIIAPGIGISSEALFSEASRLYRVALQRPERVIGKNTVGAMQSGIYYGYIGLVDGILARLHDELPGLEFVVATGGVAEMIAEGSEFITHVDPLLTLTGLKLIHERNR